MGDNNKDVGEILDMTECTSAIVAGVASCVGDDDDGEYWGSTIGTSQ